MILRKKNLGSFQKGFDPVIVTGVGRTGTSAVAGILYHLGVFMGYNFTPIDHTNVHGFYGDKEFSELTKAVAHKKLHSVEGTAKLDKLVAERRKLKKPWGFKDPMITEVLPFYLDYFKDPKIIVCTRNKKDVIDSLRKSYLASIKPEEKYKKAMDNLYDARQSALDRFLKRKHLIVDYDELIKKPEAVVSRIADCLGLKATKEAVSSIKPVKKGVVSIIIPVIYRIDLTRVCIDSIKRYTKTPYELILVQEGEDEEIKKLLKGEADKYVQNKKPKGFAGAMNAGLKVAEGEYFCFLNSDIVAIPNWLEEMVKVFEDEEVGLVSPTYTEAKQYQSVDLNKGDAVTYVKDPLSLKGVCFLVRRKVIEKIGWWDESFGLGGGDDNDMCLRVVRSGYRLAIARRSYIYHYGSASFREEFENDAEYSKKFAVGQFNKVRDKYNIDKDVPRVFLAIPTLDGSLFTELGMRILQWTHSPDFNLKFVIYPYMQPLDWVRNKAVQDFLKDYFDWFCMIDNDIVPPMNCLAELLRADKDVISPLCFSVQKDDKGLTYPIPVSKRYNKDKKFETYYGRGVERVDAISGGMFLIKRKVLEKMKRPFEFRYDEFGIKTYSEDFSFSEKCNKIGIKLFINFDLQCKHVKIVDLKNINDLLVRQQQYEQT